MDINIKKDLAYVKTILNYNDNQLSDLIDVSRMTLSRWVNRNSKPSSKNVEQIYSAIYCNGLKINDLKQEMFKSNEEKNKVILFHGAKGEFIGKPSILYSDDKKDFGKGFYLGTDVKQSASFVSNYKDSSIYVFEYDLTKTKIKEYDVCNDWMMLIAYFRGKLNAYSDSKYIKTLLKQLEGIDVVIAPIADNTMYSILNDFTEGDITDKQCSYALSANRLGKQYIFLNDKAIKSSLKMIDKLYLCEDEKKYYQEIRKQETEIGKQKVKIAKREYAAKGMYIEEILK